jgi:hypothetical protein
MIANDPWKRAEQMARRHDQTTSMWLKLANDGDTAVVVFLGDPHTREAVFLNNKYTAFQEGHRAQGLKPTLRVAFNVALYDSREVKVLEQGVTFLKDLLRIREKYGLGGRAFEVQRHGAAKDPKTTYSILPEHQLTAEQQMAFQALEFHDLAALYAEAAEEQPSPAGQGGARDHVAEARTAPPTAVPQADDDRDLPF